MGLNLSFQELCFPHVRARVHVTGILYFLLSQVSQVGRDLRQHHNDFGAFTEE